MLDLELDYILIYPEYSKFWDFWDNFNNLNFIDFQAKLYSLKGTIGDIVRLRSCYLFGGKLTKDERIIAHKSLNNDQLEYLNEKKLYSIVEKQESLVGLMQNLVSKEINNKKSNKK